MVVWYAWTFNINVKDFREFVGALSVLSRGDFKEKAEFAFQVNFRIYFCIFKAKVVVLFVFEFVGVMRKWKMSGQKPLFPKFAP